MSDTAIQNAQARRDQLAAEINDFQHNITVLKQELARVDKFIADWNAFAGIEADAESKTTEKKANPPRNRVGEEAAIIIDQNARPVPRADLFKALAERGFHIYGKDAEMVLSTMMWRMQDKFVRIPAWGYWFRDRPFPPAKYVPGNIPDTRDKKADDELNEVENLL